MKDAEYQEMQAKNRQIDGEVGFDIPASSVIHCPQCSEPVWDVAFASKLNKCWGCGLAFDSDEPEDE